MARHAVGLCKHIVTNDGDFAWAVDRPVDVSVDMAAQTLLSSLGRQISPVPMGASTVFASSRSLLEGGPGQGRASTDELIPAAALPGAVEQLEALQLPTRPASLPLWCCLITRLIAPGSKEARSDEALAATRAEVAAHVKRGTWDITRVRELSAWMADPAYTEVVVGRAFVTLGIKDAESGTHRWRARAVYQGSNVWTRSGKSVYEVFEDVSNSPASLTAARCAFGVSLLRGLTATYRDAKDAYLQAKFVVEPTIANLVLLPRSWWPQSWFEDEDRQVPRFRKPAVPLVYALPGHPKAGNIWEGHVEGILVGKNSWRKVEFWRSVFLHPDGSIIILYVDDFVLLATEEAGKRHWEALAADIDFPKPADRITRYLGAHYSFDEVSAEDPSAARTITTGMSDYLLDLVRKFQQVCPHPLRRVATPYPPEKEWEPADDEPGLYQAQAASFVASGLFASLVCRGDVSVAIQRMASYVTKWAIEDDRALERLMSYLLHEHDLVLSGTLAPPDLESLTITFWPDADWNGDQRTTKSTSGLFLELTCGNPDHTFPIAWKATHQGCTSSSSAESETVAMSTALRHTALPIQTLIGEMLGGRLIPMMAKVDNTQAISAVRTGYSKKLRYLSRTHRCSIGCLHEVWNDPEIGLAIEYAETKSHKGDFFTKALGATAFVLGRDRFGLRRPGGAVEPSHEEQ